MTANMMLAMRKQSRWLQRCSNTSASTIAAARRQLHHRQTTGSWPVATYIILDGRCHVAFDEQLVRVPLVLADHVGHVPPVDVQQHLGE